MKILIVEDEIDLNNVIAKHLKKNNFSVDTVFNGEEALDFLKYSNYDLVILDIMMPKIDGFSVIKTLRDKNNNTPILLLTAMENSENKVKGLNLGADDYLTKPFDFDELLARVRAIIRRSYGNSSSSLKIDDLIVDTSRKIVKRNGIEINLTAKEYEILEYLAQNKGKILSREQIREHIWDFAYEGESNIIDVLIKNIRKKISIDNSNQIIFTKRGLGYVVKESKEKI